MSKRTNKRTNRNKKNYKKKKTKNRRVNNYKYYTKQTYGGANDESSVRDVESASPSARGNWVKANTSMSRAFDKRGIKKMVYDSMFILSCILLVVNIALIGFGVIGGSWAFIGISALMLIFKKKFMNKKNSVLPEISEETRKQKVKRLIKEPTTIVSLAELIIECVKTGTGYSILNNIDSINTAINTGGFIAGAAITIAPLGSFLLALALILCLLAILNKYYIKERRLITPPPVPNVSWMDAGVSAGGSLTERLLNPQSENVDFKELFFKEYQLAKTNILSILATKLSPDEHKKLAKFLEPPFNIRSIIQSIPGIIKPIFDFLIKYIFDLNKLEQNSPSIAKITGNKTDVTFADYVDASDMDPDHRTELMELESDLITQLETKRLEDEKHKQQRHAELREPLLTDETGEKGLGEKLSKGLGNIFGKRGGNKKRGDNKKRGNNKKRKYKTKRNNLLN